MLSLAQDYRSGPLPPSTRAPDYRVGPPLVQPLLGPSTLAPDHRIGLPLTRAPDYRAGPPRQVIIPPVQPLLDPSTQAPDYRVGPTLEEKGTVVPMASTGTVEGENRLLVVLSFLHIKMVLTPAECLHHYLRFCDPTMGDDEVEQLREELEAASKASLSRTRVIATIFFLICFVPGYAYAAFPKECKEGCRLHDILVSPVGFCVAPGLFLLTLFLLQFMECLTERVMTGQRDKIRNAVYMFYFKWIRSRTPRIQYMSSFGEWKLRIALGYITLTLLILVVSTSQNDTAVGFVVAYAMGELYCKVLDLLLGASDELVQLITTWQYHFAMRFSKVECEGSSVKRAVDPSFFSRLSNFNGTTFGLLEGEAFLIEKIEQYYYERYGQSIPASKKRHIQQIKICIGGSCIDPVKESVTAAPASLAAAQMEFPAPVAMRAATKPLRRAHTTGTSNQASNWGFQEFKAVANGFANMTPAEMEALFKYGESLSEMIKAKVPKREPETEETTENVCPSYSQENLPFATWGGLQAEQKPDTSTGKLQLSYQNNRLSLDYGQMSTQDVAHWSQHWSLIGGPMGSPFYDPDAGGQYIASPPGSPLYDPDAGGQYIRGPMMSAVYDPDASDLLKSMSQPFLQSFAYAEPEKPEIIEERRRKAKKLKFRKRVAVIIVSCVFILPYIFSALYFWDRFIKHR